MSQKFFTFGKNQRRNPQDRKKKSCVCGAHSARDVKKNKHHNSTLSRLHIRATRLLTQKEFFCTRCGNSWFKSLVCPMCGEFGVVKSRKHGKEDEQEGYKLNEL